MIPYLGELDVVTKDINLGTIVTIVTFLIAQSTAGVWWAATISADVSAMRTWQLRQDSRLSELESSMSINNTQNAAITALLEVLKAEVEENNQTILEVLKNAEP